jgi:hypothetical protein
MVHDNKKEEFWLDNPCILLKHFDLIPSYDKTLNEKLNCLSRIVIIITLILYYMENKYWLVFLLIGLLAIFLVKIVSTAKGEKGNESKEGFSIPATYVEGSYPMSTVPPLYAEEWQVPPPIYDVYNNTVRDGDFESVEVLEEAPMIGEYITNPSVLPHSAQSIEKMTLSDAKLYMNNEFDVDQIQYREDMTRIYKNSVDRWYKSGCNDAYSPYNSS